MSERKTDFVLEFYSEEIPAKMQSVAAAQLAKKMGDFLANHGVEDAQLDSYVAPRHLALLGRNLPINLPPRNEEKKGPRIDAPDKAIAGFLRANNLPSTDGLLIRDDPKGKFYVLEINQQGRVLADALAEFLPELVAGFSWPKSMRWGADKLRWVRPLRSILCRFDGAIVDFEIGGIKSCGVSYGHRFMAPDALEIAHADDYLGVLEHNFVIADAGVRAAMIVEEATKLARSVGAELVEDDALVSEIAGLVSWPVPLLGRIDAEFMDMPEEVLVSVMRTHQKYLALREAGGDGDGQLAPYFIIIADIKTADEGAAIRDGNERVLRARLSDGRFYWQQDFDTDWKTRLPELDKVIFYAKLGLLGDEKFGTLGQKSQRIEKLAGRCAAAFKADKTAAQQAAALAKTDLLSGMVYEFPELQGIMGGYYASAKKGELDKEGKAIYDHYKPLGPNDNIPATPEGCVVALADKIDTLMGFWLVNEKPTGSKDPYALRRAALGVIRIILESETPLPLLPLFVAATNEHFNNSPVGKRTFAKASGDLDYIKNTYKDLLGFIIDRLKIYLRDAQQSISPDIVQAVFSTPTTHLIAEYHDIFALVQRATKLQDFINSEAGGNMLAAYNRVTGILDDGDLQDTMLDEKLYKQPKIKKALVNLLKKEIVLEDARKAEKALAKALKELLKESEKITQSIEAYTDYLNQLAALRPIVDTFFEKVRVNDEKDRIIRNNRLALLKKLRDAMNNVGQLAAIEKR